MGCSPPPSISAMFMTAHRSGCRSVWRPMAQTETSPFYACHSRCPPCRMPFTRRVRAILPAPAWPRLPMVFPPVPSRLPALPPARWLKNLDGLTDGVTLAPGANVTITPSGNTLTIASTAGGGGGGSNSWSLTGNSGTSPAIGNFVGTLDNQPLELHANGQRVLRWSRAAACPM